MLSTRPYSQKEDYGHVSSTRMESKLKKVLMQAMQYEYEMKDLETKLVESLSNFRAIDSLLQDTFTGLQHTSRRTHRAMSATVPQINNELDQCVEALSELAETLPRIESQVAAIRLVYDSGRRKARSLVSDLVWLNTDFYERWRIIIFTSSSPVSWRSKALMRVFFAVSSVTCAVLALIAIHGGYMAHKQSFLWGESLMSW